MPGGGLPPHRVLDELEVEGSPVRLVAWRDAERILWIGISGRRPFSGAIGAHTGSSDDVVEFTSCSTTTASVLWGYIDLSVASCEIRTMTGGTLSAKVVALPHELSAVDRAVWGTAPEPRGTNLWTPSIVALDQRGEILGPHIYPTGAADRIAGGKHELGRWHAWVTPTNRGVMFEVLLDGHGGGGGSISPMDGGLSLGWSSGGTVNRIEGQASARVQRIEHALDDGRVVEAIVFDVPEKYVGPARAHAAFVAGGGRISGTSTAYDADGNIVARQEFGRDDEPPDHTPETTGDTTPF